MSILRVGGIPRLQSVEVDNRDLSTTWLSSVVSGEEISVEVDPWELVLNAIENAGLSDRAEWAALLALKTLRTAIEKEMES